MGLAAAAGPVVGGLLTHADVLGLSWRLVFLVNLPVAATALGLTRYLPEDRAPVPPRLDLSGTTLIGVGTVALVTPVIRAGSPGVPPATWALAALGIVLIAGFVMHQRVRARLGRPTLMETSLFRHPAFGAALAVSAVFFASSVGLSMVIVLHVQVGLGDGPLAAAATLLPWPAAMAVATTRPAGSRLGSARGCSPSACSSSWPT